MYFDKPGKDNTDKTLKFAAERGKELDIDEVVVASSTGKTAYKAMELFEGYRLTVVTYHCGFKEPFKNRMTDEVRKDIESKGMRVIASSHALSGVERSVAKKKFRHLSGAADSRHAAPAGPGYQSGRGSGHYGGGCRHPHRSRYYFDRWFRQRRRCRFGFKTGTPEQFF